MLITLERSITLHAYRTCQLLFWIDGSEMDVSVRDGRHQLRHDNSIMLNAGEAHSFEIAEDAPSVTLLALHIEPKWLRQQGRQFAACMHPKFFLTSSGIIPASARMLVDELVDVIAYEPTPDNTQLERLTVALMTALAEVYSEQKRRSNFETLGGVGCDARIRKVLSVMRESVGEPIVVEELAKLARMSRPHFFHLFKQETQLTPMAYSNMMRLEAAIREISETSDSLHEISLRLGFESQGNFTRFFRMHLGVSPSQYRRSVTVIAPERPIQEIVASSNRRFGEYSRAAALA